MRRFRLGGCGPRFFRAIGTGQGAAAFGWNMTIVDPLGIGRLVGKALFECLRLLGHSQRHRHDEGAAQSQCFPHCSERLSKGQIDAAIAEQRIVAVGKRGDAVVDEAIWTAPNHNISALE